MILSVPEGGEKTNRVLVLQKHGYLTVVVVTGLFLVMMPKFIMTTIVEDTRILLNVLLGQGVEKVLNESQKGKVTSTVVSQVLSV